MSRACDADRQVRQQLNGLGLGYDFGLDSRRSEQQIDEQIVPIVLDDSRQRSPLMDAHPLRCASSSRNSSNFVPKPSRWLHRRIAAMFTRWRRAIATATRRLCRSDQ